METVASLTSAAVFFPTHRRPAQLGIRPGETGPAGVASNEWLGHEEEDLGWEGGGSPQGLIVPTYFSADSSLGHQAPPAWTACRSILENPRTQTLDHSLGLGETSGSVCGSLC